MLQLYDIDSTWARPFATAHTGINSPNMPTEGGLIPMTIGGLNSRYSIDLYSSYIPIKGS